MESNIAGADESWSVFGDEGLICIFGIGSGTLMDDKGYPWFIATTRLMQHKKSFLVGTKTVLAEWLKRYPTLMNYVQVKYTSALRWLRWAGFTVHSSKPIGVDGQLIHEVVLRRSSV